MKIVSIDAGHGGRDPGAIGATGIQEKNICLAVAARVQEELSKIVSVHMVRETDIFIPLGRRIAPSNASCFVSIHCNAHTSQAANGIETFRPILGTSSIPLATELQQEMLKHLRLRDRGVKIRDFQVIRQQRCPAALVELGFISNPTEEALLASAQGQEKAVKAIVEGIKSFLDINAPQANIHTVASGDTLWAIARQHDLTVAQIRQLNNLTTDTLRIGQRLRLQ